MQGLWKWNVLSLRRLLNDFRSSKHNFTQSIIHLCTPVLECSAGSVAVWEGFIDQQEILSQPFLYPVKQSKLKCLLQYNGFLWSPIFVSSSVVHWCDPCTLPVKVSWIQTPSLENAPKTVYKFSVQMRMIDYSSILFAHTCCLGSQFSVTPAEGRSTGTNPEAAVNLASA